MGNSINKIRLKNSSGTESLYDIMLGVNITQAEYNALTPAQKATGTYWIQDAETEAELASNIDYDNGQSHLTSTTVQAAIDEVKDITDDAVYVMSFDSSTGTLNLRSASYTG